MTQWLRLILQNLGFQFSDAQTPIYDYSQSTIDIIRVNYIISIFKHVSVPIHYAHEEYVLQTIDTVKVKTPFVQKI